MIGLFLGDTDFSKYLLKKSKKKKKYFIIDFSKKINLKKIKILTKSVLVNLDK